MVSDRILVVDDDDSLLELMVTALKRRGYQVEQARDGFSAVKILTAQPQFSVLLTDLMMPGMSGLDLLREAKKMDEHIQVIVVTAAHDIETAISALRAYGAYDYLMKPFESMSQMLLSVERSVMHRRLLLEREMMLDRIKREAEVLRALADSTGDAVLSVNALGELQMINPAAARLIGSADLQGTCVYGSLPENLVTLINNWQAVGGDLPTVIEVPWADGSIQMVSLTPLHEPGEDATGWIAVLRDITHLKKIDTLRNQILLETAAKIRTPLVQAMNTLVDLSILTNQNERASDAVYQLTQTWKRILEWGDDLTTIIQMEADNQVRSESINLTQVLNELSQSRMESVSKASDFPVDLQIDPSLPNVCADPDLLRRLLFGLMRRATSRNERGSAIRLNARSHAGQVWISISDQGPAVNKAELPHIFERSFARGGQVNGATGLEMALVKKIIDRMGGQVWVGGQGRPGSTVFVSLPAVR